MRLTPAGIAGLPGSAPYLLMFGSGEYRKINAYLTAVPASSFASGDITRYFAGMSGAEPRWTDKEANAVPIVVHPTIGDLSVIFLPQLGLWVMTYDSRDPRGVILRFAANPWGPWSDTVLSFNLDRDHAMGVCIHNPKLRPDDGIAGPVTAGKDPAQVIGGEYAPYIIERFTRIQGRSLTQHYLLSTWNPYTTVRIRSTLSIAR